MGEAVILNGDQVYTEELIRENARLTVQVEAERQHRRDLEAALAQLKQVNAALSYQVEKATEKWSVPADDLAREKVLATKLDRAVRDLHFVMTGGGVCKVCTNKCSMCTVCEPLWKGLDD